MAKKYYDISDKNEVLEALNAKYNETPEAYASAYTNKIKDTLAGIEGSKFSYDAAADPTYAMYEKKYRENAKRSMKDTLSEAAGLTGGYGNSYGQTAGQQAYDRTMQELGDIIPQLEQNAYNRYQSDLNAKYNLLGAYRSAEDTDYGRYRDNVGDRENEISRLINLHDNAYNRDFNERQFSYQQDRDAAGDAWAREQWEYQKERDAAEDAWAREQWEYQKERDAAEDAYNRQVLDQKAAEAAAKAASSSSSGSGSSKSSSGDLGKAALSDDQLNDLVAKEKEIAVRNRNSGEAVYNSLSSMLDSGYINERDYINVLLAMGIVDYEGFLRTRGGNFNTTQRIYGKTYEDVVGNGDSRLAKYYD